MRAFGSVIQAYNTGASSYNSLQVSLNRQFARNLAGQVNYTWSRCVDDGSFASSLEEFASTGSRIATTRDTTTGTAPSTSATISAAISSTPCLSRGIGLVEGWQISSIVGIHTGLPLNVYNAGMQFYGSRGPGDPVGFTEQTIRSHPDAAQTTSSRRGSARERQIQWFDPACYEAQAPGFLGNVKRDSLPGPGTFSADISVTKNTKITERLNAAVPCGVFQLLQSL